MHIGFPFLAMAISLGVQFSTWPRIRCWKAWDVPLALGVSIINIWIIQRFFFVHSLGLYALIFKAWRVPEKASAKAWWMRRCRATNGIPVKASDTMVTSKWVFWVCGVPLWWACLCESSTTLSSTGENASVSLFLMPWSFTYSAYLK